MNEKTLTRNDVWMIFECKVKAKKGPVAAPRWLLVATSNLLQVKVNTNWQK